MPGVFLDTGGTSGTKKISYSEVCFFICKETKVGIAALKFCCKD